MLGLDCGCGNLLIFQYIPLTRMFSRMFAAVCRVYKKSNRLVGLVYSLGYDQLPYISYSMIFITCYSVWPSFVTRTDLIMQDNKSSKITCHKIKLSPLAAILQFVALLESVERKESVSQKVCPIHIHLFRWKGRFRHLRALPRNIEILVNPL